jgi:hypothetical protein
MQMQNTDMLIHQHLQQMQQIILAKDQELHHYRQRISVLEGEVTLHVKHNQALQGQVSARPVGAESSSETKDLKDQITQNHEQLLKEKEYTKVLNVSDLIYHNCRVNFWTLRRTLEMS